MATRKQIDASRRNAPRSTGPQTLAAKAVSFRIPLSRELRTRARPASASKKPPAQALSSASENPLPLPQTRCSPAQRTQFETRSAFCPRLHARHLRLRHLPPPLQPRNAPPTLLLPRPPRTGAPSRPAPSSRRGHTEVSGMSQTPFVHLHCHSDYSLLDGACAIPQLMSQVAALGMPAVALTGHGNLFGAVQFYHAAREKGIHPVIGCEVYVSQQGLKVRADTDRYNHLVLLCENQEGYRNLIKLVSTAFLEGFYYKAPHRQGPAGPARQGPDRALGLPARRHQRNPHGGPLRGRQAPGLHLHRHFR